MVIGIIGFLVDVSETSGGDWGGGCKGCGDTLVGSGQWNETGACILLESQDSAYIVGSGGSHCRRVVAVGRPCPGTGGGGTSGLRRHAYRVIRSIATGGKDIGVDLLSGGE